MSETELNFESIFGTDSNIATTCPKQSYPPGSLVKITFTAESNINPLSLAKKIGKNPFKGNPEQNYIHGFIGCSAPNSGTLLIYLFDPEIPQNAQYNGQLTLSISHIDTLELISPPSKSSATTAIPESDIQKKIEAAKSQRAERTKMINSNVSRASQNLYLALAKTLRCRWQNDDIVVNDSIIIKSPHGVADAHPYDSKARRTMVKPVNEVAFSHVQKQLSTFHSQ